MSSDQASLLKLGDIAKVKGGKRMPAGTALVASRTSHPYLRIVDFKDGSIDQKNLQYVPDEVFPAISRYVIKSTDLYISIVGTIGLVGVVPEELDGANLTENAAKICEIDCSVIDRDYLGYYLRSDMGQAEIKSLSVGSTQPKLALFRIEQINIPCPPLNAQRAISSMLGALDDRISLLRETNATLEAIAQALFKSWFVDFDPVHANAHARAQHQNSNPQAVQQNPAPHTAEAIAQNLGLDAATAALFPDHFQDSDLGPIPAGWRVVPLSEFMDFKEGPGIRNWQYTNSEEGTRFINIRCIQDGDLHLDSANRITDEEANGKYAHFHLREWDIVVSTSGTLGRSAIVRTEHLPLVLNTSVIRFRPIEGVSEFAFIHQYLNGVEFLYKLESMASGSVQKNFGPMHLKQIDLVAPPYSLLQRFEQACRPIYEKIIKNRQQAQTLTQLRDTLLPRLIAGTMRLPDAEAQIEAVVGGA